MIRELEKACIETDSTCAFHFPETFGSLFNDFGEYLDKGLEPLEEYGGSDLYAVELMNIYKCKFCLLKKLSMVKSMKSWTPLINHVGINVCHHLGLALMIKPEDKHAESELFLWKSHSLFCTVGDLKLLLRNQSCSD